jgi:hypothetical protein
MENLSAFLGSCGGLKSNEFTIATPSSFVRSSGDSLMCDFTFILDLYELIYRYFLYIHNFDLFKSGNQLVTSRFRQFLIDKFNNLVAPFFSDFGLFADITAVAPKCGHIWAPQTLASDMEIVLRFYLRDSGLMVLQGSVSCALAPLSRWPLIHLRQNVESFRVFYKRLNNLSFLEVFSFMLKPFFSSFVRYRFGFSQLFLEEFYILTCGVYAEYCLRLNDKQYFVSMTSGLAEVQRLI